jgi:hypothetical protein
LPIAAPIEMSAAAGKDSVKALWLERLSSSLRTALACTIVGCTTLYGPARLRHFLAYPAFSYVTAILIVSDATLDDTLRGCWNALYATIQVMILCLLTFQVIGPARFSNVLAAVAVAITTFMVALPESTPLMAKRIAFGQAVIVFVGAAIHGAEEGVVTHPLHVASSTALGALASVLAMLIPYPWLAYCKVNPRIFSFFLIIYIHHIAFVIIDHVRKPHTQILYPASKLQNRSSISPGPLSFVTFFLCLFVLVIDPLPEFVDSQQCLFCLPTILVQESCKYIILQSSIRS